MEQQNTAYDGAVVFEARLDSTQFEAGVQQMGDTLSQMIGEMAGASAQAVEMGERILLALSPLPAGAEGIARSAADGFLASFGTMTAGGAEAAAAAKAGILSTLATLPSELAEIGQSAMAGLLNAISGAAQKVSHSVSDMVRGAVNRAKEVLEIHSPSRVMAREVGTPMAQGVLTGIQTALPALEQGIAQSFSYSTLIQNPAPASFTPKSEGSLSLGGITVNWYGGDSDVDVNRLARVLGQRVAAELRWKGGGL